MATDPPSVHMAKAQIMFLLWPLILGDLFASHVKSTVAVFINTGTMILRLIYSASEKISPPFFL